MIIPQPLRICQRVYGKQNVNQVRDAVVNCYRRFLGSDALSHPDVYCALMCVFSDILRDAGRNPNAVKLVVSPDRLQPNPFPVFLNESHGDKEQAYERAMRYVMEQQVQSDDEWRDMVTHIYIDYHSV